MSTTTTTISPVTISPVTGTWWSTRAELLRLRKWPAVWVTIGAWLSLSALFGYVFNYVAYATGNSGFSNEGESSASLLASIMPAGVPDTFLQGMPMFGGALMMVLGAIVAGNGYGWGTWKTAYTQGPSRQSTVLGSMAALTVFVAGIMVVTLVFDLALSLVVAGVESQGVVWPSLGSVGQSAVVGFLVLEMWTLAGFLLGTVARGPALSVGLGLVWALVLENLLRGVGSLLSWVDAFTHVLPGTAAGSLVGSVVGTGGPDPTPGVLDTISGTQAAWTVAAYVVMLALVSVLLVRRRDLT
jgi:ABC-2 type transport system permease protein